MNFLAPLFLAGAAAIIAPIIFHLIKRTTRDRKIFSSLMFLSASPPKLTRKSRLDDILLLLLRCLALALFAFAFSRPFIRNAAINDAITSPARRVVLLVDVSASMRRGGLWAAALDRASAQVRKLAPQDHLAVYTFGRETKELVSFDDWDKAAPAQRPGLVASRLDAGKPGWGSTHLGNAVMAAADALADTEAQKKIPGPKEIVLISDMQSGSQLDSLQSFEWPKGLQLTVDALKPSSSGNAGLQVLPDAAEADDAQTATVRVRVTNSADSKKENFQVGWTRPGAAGFVGPAIDLYVPPGQTRIGLVPVPAGAAGLQQISLTGDDEDFDNVGYVIPPEKQKVSVLYLGNEAAGDETAPLFFLERAFPNTPRLQVTVVAKSPAASLAPNDTQDAKLYFVTDAPSAANIAELRAQMQAGKTVVFVPKGPAAGTALGQLAGVEGLTLEEALPPAKQGTSYSMLVDVDFKHPVFATFSDPRYSDFTKVFIWRYRRIKADAIPGARVLARFDSSGDPAVLEVAVGKGRLLAIMTGWNKVDSSLATSNGSTKFVPLIGSILDYAGGIAGQTSQFTVGDVIPIEAAGPTAGAAVTVTLPNGTQVPFGMGASAFNLAVEPGVYTLAAGTHTSRFTVNLDPAESRTQPRDADELERYGAPGAQAVVDPTREARRAALMQASEAEEHQKLWRWFIVAMLLVLLGESGLAGWTARRNAATVN